MESKHSDDHVVIDKEVAGLKVLTFQLIGRRLQTRQINLGGRMFHHRTRDVGSEAGLRDYEMSASLA